MPKKKVRSIERKEKFDSIDEAVFSYFLWSSRQPEMQQFSVLQRVVVPYVRFHTPSAHQLNEDELLDEIYNALSKKLPGIKYGTYNEGNEGDQKGAVKASDELYDYRHKHKEQQHEKPPKLKTIVEPTSIKEITGKNGKRTTEKTPKYEHAYI